MCVRFPRPKISTCFEAYFIVCTYLLTASLASGISQDKYTHHCSCGGDLKKVGLAESGTNCWATFLTVMQLTVPKVLKLLSLFDVVCG